MKRRRDAPDAPEPRPAYHLRIRPGDLPETVLLPGDPARAGRIAATWESSRPVADHREFRSFTGRVRGVPIGVVSTGIGGPAMAIAVEELAAAGVRTLIRVGSCGVVDPELEGCEVAISLASARFETVSRAYAPPAFPAVADPEVYRALVEAARSLGTRFRSGITATVDTFHASQGRPGFRPLPPAPGAPSLADLRAWGLLNIEMESSVLLTLARLYRLRAGAVCAVYPDGTDGDPMPRGEEASIQVANEAVVRLAAGDPADRHGP